MIILIYSEINEDLIQARLGAAEYSYYFVLKEFRPVLEKLGRVILVKNPNLEADAIFRDAARRNEPCVLFSFSPPHRTPLGLACPTIPVFAWEFDTVPNETWFGEKQQDWRYGLNKMGRAITHSAHTADVVRSQLGDDFPIVSIPAPVFDRFATGYHPSATGLARASLSLAGRAVDTRNARALYERSVGNDGHAEIQLDGVVYLSIFSPHDGRKNPADMIASFCEALRDAEDATLVLKLTNRRVADAIPALQRQLRRLMPFKCRVLILTGYLDGETYARLVAAASYAVNTSHGEGQCLPLMELMACGKPAVAPRHTAMVDYINEENAFVVRSNAEPASWPQDPRHAIRTLRQRIDFESLVQAYRESYRVTKEEPARYARMAENAHETQRRHCSQARTAERLVDFLARPARPAASRPELGEIRSRVDAPWTTGISASSRVLEYGGDLDLIGFALARLGARVDTVGRTRDVCDTVRDLANRCGVALSAYVGEIGLNPAGVPGAYDLILICANSSNRAVLKTSAQGLRALLAPQGRILLFGEPVHLALQDVLATNALPSWTEIASRSVRNLAGFGFIETDWVRLFANAGFVWRRFGAKTGNRSLPICEFRVWSAPLHLADCCLTRNEEATWHGRELIGRWTKARTILNLPSRDGAIEISARNYRATRCIGKMRFGDQAAEIDVESGGALKTRFAQSSSRSNQRLVITSDLSVGGPTDPRELGICIESVSPV